MNKTASILIKSQSNRKKINALTNRQRTHIVNCGASRNNSCNGNAKYGTLCVYCLGTRHFQQQQQKKPSRMMLLCRIYVTDNNKTYLNFR